MVPLRLGAADEFRRVRSFLQDANYCEEPVCARLGLPHIYDLDAHRPNPSQSPPSDCLDALARLFFQGEAIRREQVRAVIPGAVLASMEALGLLCAFAGATDCLMATVFLCPIGPLHLAADRWTHPDNSAFTMSADAVYPPNSPHTRQFLALLPPLRCDCLIDLGTGTGAAALLAAAQYAGHAWAADIAPRSAHFAEFNRRLNEISNVTTVCGDLYEPAGELQFDRIVAHPPFAPVLAPRYIFHDGGEDGEAITRRVVEGAPRHLRRGGRLYCLALGSDREQEFQDRVRQWLGEAGADCDVMVVVWNHLAPEAFAEDAARKSGKPDEQQRWLQRLQELEIRKLLHASIVVQRRSGAGQPFTARRVAGARSTQAEIEWQLSCEALGSDPEALALVAGAKPLVSADVLLSVGYRMRHGCMTPEEHRVRTEYPFPIEAKLEPWMADLLATCDGSKTTLELLAAVKQRKLIAADTPPEKFAALIYSLMARGFVRIPELSVPAAAG